MKKFIVVTVLSIFFVGAWAQSEGERPKLVVGIIVDQMRQEYLYRFYKKFGEGGFKRLMNEGFMLKNAHFNYMPTVTAAGHASVFTGTTPAVHGIIGNEWFDKVSKTRVYCVRDLRYKTVGSAPVEDGNTSPHRLLSTTISDELKISTQDRSRVIGISIKDRGAVLPVGFSADGAYWFDKVSGKFITSTYYMEKLPEWIENFNKLGLAEKYASQVWKPLLPLEQYTESLPEAKSDAYEGKLEGADNTTFPYDIAAMKAKSGSFETLSQTPFSDDLLTELAKAAIDGEKLGSDEWTDFLSISFSAPDKLGHEVGPNAVELEDLYIRLDKNLEDLFKKLDQVVGIQNYTVFLTADHAVSESPAHMTDKRIPAGAVSLSKLQTRLSDYMKAYYPDKKLILDVSNEQIFLNHEVFDGDPKRGGVDLLVATELISGFMLKEKGVANVFSKSLIRQGNFSEGGYKGMVIRGYHIKRSGDIAFIFEPNWMTFKVKGTSHGAPYVHDTHVPVLFFGKGVKKGSSVQYYSITDIAPTISTMLNIKFPNGCTGQPIGELFE